MKYTSKTILCFILLIALFYLCINSKKNKYTPNKLSYKVEKATPIISDDEEILLNIKGKVTVNKNLFKINLNLDGFIIDQNNFRIELSSKKKDEVIIGANGNLFWLWSRNLNKNKVFCQYLKELSVKDLRIEYLPEIIFLHLRYKSTIFETKQSLLFRNNIYGLNITQKDKHYIELKENNNIILSSVCDELIKINGSYLFSSGIFDWKKEGVKGNWHITNIKSSDVSQELFNPTSLNLPLGPLATAP